MMAGYIPKNRPTLMETATARMIGQRGHSEIDEQADGPAKNHADDAAGASEDDGFG